MRSFVSFLCLLAIAGAPAAAGQTRVPPGHWGKNLVGNPGFESGAAGWNLVPGQCTLDEADPHGGTRCLRFANTDPARYGLVTAPVGILPGVRYRISAWVRGKDVRDGDVHQQGAGLCIEWTDAKGNWLGGHYPSCKSGTFGWTKLEGETGPVPPKAARGHVVLYLRKHNVGTAWFDDVEVRAIRGPLLAVRLLEPAYRACVETPTAGKALTVAVIVNRREHDVPARALLIKARLRDLSGPPLATFAAQRVPQGQDAARLSWKLPRLVPRGYILDVFLNDRGGKQLGATKKMLHVARPRKRKVTLDGRGRLIVGGKPFFPLGLYLGPTEDEHLARIAKGGFNTILCYGYGVAKDPRAYLDRAQRHGLKVVYSVKDFYDGTRWFPKQEKTGIELTRHYVSQFRGHPALLAWYTNDELGPKHMPGLQAAYDLVCKLDPDHPAFQVLCRPRENHLYYGVTDILGVDPYPIPRHPATMVGDWMETAHKAMSRAKPVWCVPQIFQWGVYHHDAKQREPTFDEKRAMIYLALIHRANGLICYSYYDLFKAAEKGKRAPDAVFQRRWGEVARIAATVRKVIPLLLEGEETHADLESPVRCRVLRVKETACVIVVNTAQNAAAVAIPVPVGTAATQLDTGRAAVVRDGKLVDRLGPLGAAIYKVEQRN